VLAGELERSHGDHVAAFGRYEEVMRPYVARGQEFPPGGVAGFAPNRQAMIRMRMISMRWMTRWPMRALIAAQFAKAGDIALPDYPQPSRLAPPAAA
jgi:2-polyprenyl-6-methoxyphenol hydroxylase-like FAD-dependent oxidoreductase